MIETPVAFFIFKRPELTKTVFDAIRQVKPKTLLMIADGPRNQKEKTECDQARDIVKDVGWDCRVLTNFSDTNLGCKKRVSSGLDWVFSQVEEAIILEDDCLPSPEFFSFCQQMLERYRKDPRVMLIDGFHFDDGIRRESSYYFSRFPGIWGWASWRRAWQYYDVDMKTWPQLKKSHGLKRLFDDVDEQIYWKNIFDKIYSGKIDTWDYQWVYACLINEGLTIKPGVNLVKNLGYGKNATHTHSYDRSLADLPIGSLGEIRHPPAVEVDARADEYIFDQFGRKEVRSSLRCRLQAWSLGLRGH